MVDDASASPEPLGISLENEDLSATSMPERNVVEATPQGGWDFSAAPNVQYEVLATRDQHFNNLAWQVPAIAIASQSFLLAVSLNH